MSQEKAYWLAWSHVRGIGPTLLKRIEQKFGSLSQAWQLPVAELGKVEGFGGAIISKVQEERPKINPAQLLEKHLQDNPQFWTPADPDYPRLLLEIPSPPPVLYYRGQVDLQENLGKVPAIAIVGTRYPTAYAKSWTRKIAKTLAEQGFIIVSGMAAGIDAEAHWSCLKANRRTIAVLGTGVDRIYPHSNQKLYQQLEQEGLLLSEYPAGAKPERGNFPARNRIIAGLSRAVLIMEAPQKSGALITARFANDFCRDVYVLPGTLDNQQAIGCLDLLNRGAHVILSETHLLEMLQTIPMLDPSTGDRSFPSSKKSQLTLDFSDSKLNITSPPPQKRDFSHLEPELAQIMSIMRSESLSLDAIAEKTGLDTGKLLASLSQLEIMGLISQLPGMRYVAT
ncbi:DNA protecting protein DprA [Xenococcus sp. PCC 7305]|uniref:DNA-processing protein DprA n=1 Tax=Xenococcus sp. PCC 7305 TaxID=102125 RepID=UPI0002ABB879|nr:DNA-processing protein DprA [Xenococcus sp. PCC 7305]ELS02954.1 DNA protecting protein DprA [Xenococcus sp. PCC 7305]